MESGKQQNVAPQQQAQTQQQPQQVVVAQSPNVQYVRQQKGHSVVFWVIFGIFTLWIPAIYYTVSPNHYWHL